ncbi:hypothetical protein [Lactobacillus crispatus]|jgi:hypothetical protein|uniref:Holin n=1 Tax=Myoviridae sp. ct1PY2 TaxID=2826602 RepID=A0A8S5MM46_9CAUD|nr:hypothetical protein [Lactobacillus crispatus]EEJ70439.1 hypothetical protein HMPREF0506_0553 [Lactobacillus crispatus JV-V01]MBG0732559.1 hypothetical protein [Lactobacillus crispatus]PKZ27513.1 hypothetical protein CYJ78_05770 [Lactobacillus crispatus]DAD83011.1 MAG TPA: holin [Myoviridae sp. ct1PY2]
MSLTQLTDYAWIAFLAIVAVCVGVSTGIDYFAKRSAKPLPKQVMTIDEIAKFVVSEAATLDVSGAQKKIQAVQALLDQAKQENKPVTEAVAKGAVQHAYDQMVADQAKNGATQDYDAKQIGFVSGDENGQD